MSSLIGGPGYGHFERESQTTVFQEPQAQPPQSDCPSKRNEYSEEQFVELRRRNAAMEEKMAALKQRLAEKEAIIERLKVRLGSRSPGVFQVDKL